MTTSLTAGGEPAMVVKLLTPEQERASRAAAAPAARR
jgi:hypothetical protein